LADTEAGRLDDLPAWCQTPGDTPGLQRGVPSTTVRKNRPTEENDPALKLLLPFFIDNYFAAGPLSHLLMDATLTICCSKSL